MRRGAASKTFGHPTPDSSARTQVRRTFLLRIPRRPPISVGLGNRVGQQGLDREAARAAFSHPSNKRRLPGDVHPPPVVSRRRKRTALWGPAPRQTGNSRTSEKQLQLARHFTTQVRGLAANNDLSIDRKRRTGLRSRGTPEWHRGLRHGHVLTRTHSVQSCTTGTSFRFPGLFTIRGRLTMESEIAGGLAQSDLPGNFYILSGKPVPTVLGQRDFVGALALDR